MNSKILLCKDINLDRSYVNVLNYTETQMLTLLQQQSHLVYQASDFQFIRQDRNEIQVSFPYGSVLQCNYMAFQNPNYSNKWFFAFIDDVIYDGEKTTRVKFTVDEHTTWFDYWDAKSCLVIREHVASDNVGEHTYPEGLEHGDYICNAYEEVGGFTQDSSKIIIGTTWLPSNTPNLPSAQVYGGVFSGVYYVAFPMTGADAKNFCLALDGLGRGDAIITAFMAPASLCANATNFTGTIHSKLNNDDGTTSDHDFTISGAFIGNDFGGVHMITDKQVTSPSTINGYTPRNNKLFVSPYNTLLVSNNNGSTSEYHYEDFINNTPLFNMYGTLCPGCSIRLFPKNYKKIGDGVSTHPGFSYGLVGGKFPICSWQNDAFTNWMTQQSVNHTTMFFEEALSLGTGQLSSGEFSSSDMGFGGGNIYETGKNYMNQVYQHSLVGRQMHGSLNGADVSFAIDENNFSFYKMSIKAEYARMIDDYLTKYGYKINRIKVPNMISRSNWNYIQIGGQEEIGYSNSSGSVPASSMDIINNIYRRGVTIWHNHNNIGNYSLSNNIVS